MFIYYFAVFSVVRTHSNGYGQLVWDSFGYSLLLREDFTSKWNHGGVTLRIGSCGEPTSSQLNMLSIRKNNAPDDSMRVDSVFHYLQCFCISQVVRDFFHLYSRKAYDDTRTCNMHTYCCWKESCTSWCSRYHPSIHRIFMDFIHVR